MSTQNHDFSTQEILQNLQSSDVDSIRSASFAAGDAGLVEAIPALCEHIQSSNIGVQEAAEYALRKIRGKNTIVKMLPLLNSDVPSLRNIAMDVLREIGCDDIDAINPYLRDADPDLRIFMADILGHTKSRKAMSLLCEALLKDPEVNVRYQAAMSLGTLGFPEAAEALHQAMQDEEWVQFSAIESLTKIRDDSTIGTFVKILPTCSPLVASVIIDALGEMQNIKAVPLLLQFIAKAAPVLRHKAVKAIVQILGEHSLSLLSGTEKERFKEYLEESLGDEDESIQEAALIGLSAMGDGVSSRIIMEYILQNHTNPENELYQLALASLTAIGYNDEFAKFLQQDDQVVIRIALEAALNIEGSQCMDGIIALFWNSDYETQRAAALYMAHHAALEHANFALDILKQHTDSGVIKYIMQCLGITLRYAPAQDHIFEQLNHPYTDVQEVALEACVVLNTPELSTRFKGMFAQGEEEMRLLALYALSNTDFQKNISIIYQGLEDESLYVRQMAVESFANANVDLHEHIEKLLAMLDDPADEVRISVVDVLGSSNNASIIPYLEKALEDNNEWVCIRAIEALGSQRTENSVGQLLAHFEKASLMVSLKIIETLAQIGGNVAFRALLDMMHHEDPEIQNAAAEAIERLKEG